MATLSERFDLSTVHPVQVLARLTKIRNQVATDRARYQRAHLELQEDAVNAHVYDEPATSLSSMFSSASDGSTPHNECLDAVIGNVTPLSLASIQASISS